MEAQPPLAGTPGSDAHSAGRDGAAESTASSADELGHRRQQVASLWAATELAQDLDIDRLAQRVVEGVTEVTDFTVATLTVRDGDTCRRVAAAGVDEPRIGLETSYRDWAALLPDDYRARSSCFVIPPQASQPDWVQTVPLRRRSGTQTDREPWTEQHGLVVELLDEEGERIGFVSVDAPRSGMLPDDTELEHLELFARQAQSGLRNARLHGQVLRQRDAAEALNAVVRAVSGSLELREVLRLCCDAVVDRSVGDRASIYLHDAEAGHFRTVMSRGDMPQDPAMWAAFKARPPATPDDTPAIAEVMRTGEPLLIGEVTPEHIRAEDLALFGSKSLAVYPMRSGDRLTGMLMVDTMREHLDFPRHEVELVTQIASQAAVAIHQAQLHEAARAQGARADELYELTKQMTRTFDFDVVFERIVAAVTERTSAYAVGLMEAVDGELVLLRANLAPDDDAPLPFQRLRIADIPAELWRPLTEDGVVSIDDIRRTGMGVHALPEARSVLVTAHRDEAELSLILHVTSTRVAGFSPDDAAFVKGLVEVAALALRNARLYEEMRRTSERDGLTGLKNRRVYRRDVPPLLVEATPERPVSLAMIDLDDFKAVNDRHGHDVGDRALVHVADRLTRAVREDDHTYRLGGEEFAIVMPDTTPDNALKVLERLRQTIGASRSALPTVTISAGVAVAPQHGADLDTLFRAADAALYEAKAAGKDTVRLARSDLPALDRDRR